MNKIMTKIFTLVLLMTAGLLSNAFAADQESLLSNKIENIDFSALSGGRVSIRIQMKDALVNPPAGFTLNNPARIALDFPQTANGLAKSNIVSEQGALKSISLAQAKDRTRMVLNLSRNVSYNTVLSGKDVIITLQGNEAGVGTAASETRFAEAKATNQEHAISNVDFARGKNGEGRIIVDLSDPNTGINSTNVNIFVIILFMSIPIIYSCRLILEFRSTQSPVRSS